MSQRWICLDVGETLIDETRVWSVWAEVLGIPAMTFLAAFGAAISRGMPPDTAFDLVGVPDWRAHAAEVEGRFGGFQEVDLYPDALPAISALRAGGHRIAVIANQPASRAAQLRGLGVDPDVMAMSEAMGVSKPDPAFFRDALARMGKPMPGDVAYVGDRPDNDVGPALAAGMRAVWLRRGPWGVIASDAPGADLVVRSLTELTERVGELWSNDPDTRGLA